MARPCTICKHAKRKAIDAALVDGSASLRGIAARFAVGDDAVRRHKAGCLASAMARGAAVAVERQAEAKAAAEIAHGSDLRSQATAGLNTALRLVDSAQEILDRARDEADHATALDAVRASAVALREARAHVELLGRATGELRTGTTIEIHASAPFIEARDVILGALAPYPEALAAVVSALKTAAERKRLGR